MAFRPMMKILDPTADNLAWESKPWKLPSETASFARNKETFQLHTPSTSSSKRRLAAWRPKSAAETANTVVWIRPWRWRRSRKEGESRRRAQRRHQKERGTESEREWQRRSERGERIDLEGDKPGREKKKLIKNDKIVLQCSLTNKGVL